MAVGLGEKISFAAGFRVRRSFVSKGLEHLEGALTTGSVLLVVCCPPDVGFAFPTAWELNGGVKIFPREVTVLFAGCSSLTNGRRGPLLVVGRAFGCTDISKSGWGRWVVRATVRVMFPCRLVSSFDDGTFTVVG